MACTNSPSSRSASRTGTRQGRRGGRIWLSKSPWKRRARKRHRGGGGLAVPGPFKRIARAGGQKVTIRRAERTLFEISSAHLDNFFAGDETIRISFDQRGLGCRC